jgi:hypothetical protein
MIINGEQNEAIQNAILDFIYTEKKILKYDKVFSISTKEDKDNISVSILGISTPISLIIEEDGSYNYCLFPTMLIETNGKLFLGYDETKNVTDTIINTLYRYNLIDTMSVYTVTMIIDDTKKGVDYYFCKNNLSKYKKVITNKAMGYYKPPKLKCK